MAAVKFGSITVIVKGYYSNNGKAYFQRAVPPDLVARFGKSKISIPLDEGIHAAVQCERLTQRFKALFRSLRNDPQLTAPDIKAAALAWLGTYGLAQGDANHLTLMPSNWEGTFDSTPHLNAFHEAVEDDYRAGNPAAIAAVTALRKPLPVLLSEAFEVYVANHKKGNDKDFIFAQRQHWKKLIGFLGDISVESVDREKARNFRDFRLSTGIKGTSVERELTVVKAVFNVVRREIPLTMNNPFESLTIPLNLENPEEERDPYTRAELTTLVEAALQLDDERRRLMIVLALTGARLAEIVGLRRQDIDLEIGLIEITPHAKRRLKNKASERQIPLLPIALEAMKRQLSEANDTFAFPSYNKHAKTSSDSASAALNKWAKGVVPDKTMHCFRHTLRDQLREVSCPEAVSKEIGGWSNVQDVSAGYGKGSSIDVKRKWLLDAYVWLAA